MKTCNRCGETKPIPEFYANCGMSDGRLKQCKVCTLAAQKAWKETNREAYLAAKKRDYEKNKEKRLASMRRRYERDTERILASQREYEQRRRREDGGAVRAREAEYRRRERVRIRAIAARWRDANRAAYRAQRAEDRAARARRVVPWADQAAIAAVYEQAARVSRCTGVPHHVDHVIPLRGRNVSGLHVVANLRVVPEKLNLAKSNRFEVEA